MEYCVLGLFAALLIGCVALNISVVVALLAGLALFCSYALRRGFSLRQVGKMCLDGIRTVKNVLLTFVFIGLLTGMWRACGTIPAIVCYAVRLISPPVFLCLTFLLNVLISFLTGTSFGSAATMGVVCMTIGRTLGADPVWTGGAILSGIYFGDRCSPVSTSALLVAELTKTDIFGNLRGMMKTAVVPFGLSCGIYLLAGLRQAGEGGAAAVNGVEELFRQGFALGPVPLLPAVVILSLSLCRVSVRKSMGASVAVAVAVSLLWQHSHPAALLRTMVLGFQAEDPALAAMLNGGGLKSMINVTCIVCLSSSFSGIFRETGLLDPVRGLIGRGMQRFSPFAVILPVSVASCAIGCSQTLAIMLTKQLCESPEQDGRRFALDLENSAVIVAPLIPWCIAGAVPLATVGAPTWSILTACYLYLIPLWNLLTSLTVGRNRKDRP